MTIQKRLEKLERDSNINSTVCTCPGENLIRVILPDPETSEADRLREQKQMMRPEYCERCRKLIEHQYIIVEPVSSEIN